MRRALVAAVALALLAPATASAGRWAVGVPSLPGAKTLVPGRAVLVTSPTRPHVPGAAFVERLDGVRRLAFDNTEPLAARQWYIQQDHAWDFWSEPPKLFAVRVAVIDSGLDCDHPEFLTRIAASRSFVGGTPCRDTEGHGTFVSGLIAANAANNEGIAGIGVNVQLVVAKVVEPDGSVSLQGEVEAIRWAIENGARVLNLSLGGVRDPFNPNVDTYSPLEQAAVEYAYSKGAVVVAAVGNGPQSPKTPWNYAHYPAALPHVIGVSALRENGSVPDYSNRDAVYNDIAAPGDAIFSTIPRNLVEDKPGCTNHPYSDCGPFEFRNAIGTSFAAPQVSAAAALVLGQNPNLRPEQVAWLLERTADDATAASGCDKCLPGRDMYAGWGRLNVLNALLQLTDGPPLPRADSFEPNDDAGVWARPFGPPRTISATLDYWDDQIDVYSITLTRGRRVFARLTPPARTAMKLVLWKPKTRRVEGLRVPLANRAAQSARIGGQERLAYTATAPGTYYLEVKLVAPTQDPVTYRLGVAARRP
jgi:Subtilase family